ncbi:MAG: coproporphyrinogen III oxidase [Rhodospirillales bacterium]|nr:coproporphyrinogen III oxidase [Rhodospirillales bacterium]
MAATDPGFGVYVHWPFCQSKCPYCNFNSHVREAVDHNAWRAALVRETAHMAEQMPGRTVTSVFFGGGTPSLMEPATVEAVLDAIAAHWSVDPDVEITLEANPGSVEVNRFVGYRVAGVNRVSLGVQALDDNALRALGRRHDLAEAEQALMVARAVFERLSFDLIYARMGQTPADWQAELDRTLAYETDHLSLYQLTIEQGTQFHTLARRGALDLPCEDDQAAMYELTQERTEKAGLPAYEISNHARPGQESRHNTVYWRSGEWAGVGPGAHGRLNQPGGRSVHRCQQRAPEIWLKEVGHNGHGTAEIETIEGPDRLAEVLMMGLRLSNGLGAHDLERACGPAWQDDLDHDRLDGLVNDGYLDRPADGLRATAKGRPVLNAVLARLLS